MEFRVEVWAMGLFGLFEDFEMFRHGLGLSDRVRFAGFDAIADRWFVQIQPVL
jgi:hypothetical protein